MHTIKKIAKMFSSENMSLSFSERKKFISLSNYHIHNFLYFSFQVSVNEILPQWIGIITGQSKSISSFLWVFQTEGGLGRTLGKY